MLKLLERSFSDGSIVDLIFAFIAIECVALLLYRKYVKGFEVTEIIMLMLPGIFLLLALRSALSGASWPIVAGWLLASLIAHLGDLAMRFRSRAAEKLSARGAIRY
jgi:uncharacterized membrane protein YjjP (DUF1212 family)